MIKEQSLYKAPKQSSMIAEQKFDESIEKIVRKFESESHFITQNDSIVKKDGLIDIFKLTGVFAPESIQKTFDLDKNSSRRKQFQAERVQE